MRRLWFFLTAVFSLLVLFRVSASAVQLDTSWYAKVTYVTLTGGSWEDVWFTPAFGSTHLAGTRLNYVDGTTLVYGTLFTVSTGGGAALGESAYAQEVLNPPYTLGNLSFHYETYWTRPALELRVYGVYLGPRGDGPRLLWSSGAVGGASGDVFINENPSGYRFEFVVVPEFQSCVTLGIMLMFAALCLARRLRSPVAVIALLAAISLPATAGISPMNLAVIANTNPALKASPSDALTMSQEVARYYCMKRSVPLSNLIEINAPSDESVYTGDFPAIAQQIRDKLVSQLGVNPDDPAGDPIQVLVLCYGVPSRIIATPPWVNQSSVDSYLSLLFNTNPDITPGTATNLFNVHNGRNIDFATFRASADNSIPGYGYRLRYLVCRLDGYESPAVDVPGFGTMPRDVKDMIDRGARSAGQQGRFVLDEPWHA